MRKFNEKTLVIATHNQGKLEEIEKLLEGYTISLLSSQSLKIDEPDETETSFEGNARIKAHYASKKSGYPALSDDSGLEVDCLNGAPGVFTANWAETKNGRDFKYAMEKLWAKVLETKTSKPYKARFVSTLALAWPDGHDEIFQGFISGELTWPMSGTNGHGFDPVFKPNGYTQTFGEMDRWKKNIISHRGIAFNKLKKSCLINTATNN